MSQFAEISDVHKDTVFYKLGFTGALHERSGSTYGPWSNDWGAFDVVMANTFQFVHFSLATWQLKRFFIFSKPRKLIASLKVLTSHYSKKHFFVLQNALV